MEVSMVLDVEKSKNRFTTLNDAITIRQGDGLSYILDVSIRQQGEYFNLEGYDIRLYATKPSGDVVMDGKNITLLEPDIGHVTYIIPPELVAEQGRITNCYFRITEANSEESEYSITTESFTLEVIKGVTLSLLDGDYIPELDDLLNELEECRNKFDDAEWTRQENEESRINSEAARVSSEDDREEAEAQRREAEKLREENEQERITSENERVAAEELRNLKFEEYEARAKGWARYVCTEGEYDEVSRIPTLENPSAGTLYYVPLAEVDQEEGNRYEEWTYTEIGWEKLGRADMFYSAIGADEIDRVLAFESLEGGAALTLSGLTYLWSGMDTFFTGKFAPTAHTHVLESLDGELPSSKVNYDENIGKLARALWQPGFILQSFDPTSPAKIYGGTWQQLTDVFLRAANNTNTGGSDSITLTTQNMPAHNHSFTGTKAAHRHTFTGTAASHGHTFTGTAASHGHTFTGTAASHSHNANSTNTSVHFPTVNGMSKGKAWSGSTTGEFYSLWTTTSAGLSSSRTTQATSITPSGSISNTSVTPSGSISNTSITPAGTLNDINLIPAGTISTTGGGAAFDNRPKFQNVYTWRLISWEV